MIVLGFDTATNATVVGLRLPDGSTLRARDDPPAGAHPGHATRLLTMAAELLARAELRWNALERIVVGVGPGRFTGLRVGIATARGLAQSLAADLVGVSSLRALALGSIDRLGGEAAGRGGTIAVIDARRGEAFAAAYPELEPVSTRCASRPEELSRREIELPRALGAQALECLVATLEQRGAPAGEGWLAVGDGAVRYAAELRAGGVDVAPEDSPLHLLDGAALCELGARADAADRLETVLPDYRREPDAVHARDRAPALPGTGS
jgi:tRNA threonylcarbamoyladenosine biosynthesis protein TsaB